MKKIIYSAFFACIVGLAIYAFFSNENHSNKSCDLYLMNIEALSEGESLVDLCNQNCITDLEYNCLLYTNNLGTITCLDSYPKFK